MFKKIEIKISLLILAFGIFANNPFLLDNKEKAFIGIFLYSLPLLFAASKASKLAKIYALWFGIFLISESIIFFNFSKENFITLRPNINKKINIEAGIMADIEGEQKIVTDSKGFRVTKNINYNSKATDSYRIFAIGGSTTEQIYIDQFKTWTHLLQEKLNRKYSAKNFEVINTGVSGLRAVSHVATLEKITKYHPDMAIFLIGINDWNHQITFNYSAAPNNDSYNIAKIVDKLAFEKTWHAIIVPVRDEIKTKIFKIKNEKKSEIKEGFYGIGSLFKNDKRTFEPDDVSIEYKNNLEKINQICDENKIKCVFLTQPNGYKKTASEKYKKLFWMTPPEQGYTLTFESMIHIAKLYNNYMISFAKNNNKIFCDIDSDVPASNEYMCDDCHFSLKGARKVSELIFNCIEKNYDFY